MGSWILDIGIKPSRVRHPRLDRGSLLSAYKYAALSDPRARAGMTMCLGVMLFILLFSALSCLAQESPQDPIKKTEDYLNSLTTIQSDFLQISPEGKESTGKFYLSRPGKIRWQYEPPVPVLIIVANGLVSYYDAELDQVSHVPSSSNLAAFLARDRIALSGDIKVLSAKEEFGLITIVITQSRKPEEGNLTLIFSSDPMQLKKMVVTDASGKETQVSFSNPIFGVPLEDSLFIMPNPRLHERPRSRN